MLNMTQDVPALLYSFHDCVPFLLLFFLFFWFVVAFITRRSPCRDQERQYPNLVSIYSVLLFYTNSMEGYQVNTMVCLGVTFGLATVSLLLRLAARKVTCVSLWWDDYLGIAAYLFAAAWGAMIIKCKQFDHQACVAWTKGRIVSLLVFSFLFVLFSKYNEL